MSKPFINSAPDHLVNLVEVQDVTQSLCGETEELEGKMAF